MKKISPCRVVFVLFVLLVFIAGIVCLRVNNLIDSRDFSLLLIAFLIGSFVIIFLEKISEVTLIGNTVKLQQINEKSEELLENLQIEHFKIRIDLAFSPSNFFNEGDSVYTCRARLFEVAKNIKDAGLEKNQELKNKILPLLINHTKFQLRDIHWYGNKLEVNPLESIEEPQLLVDSLSDDLIDSATISGATTKLGKVKTILENIEIYKNLRTATKWFED